MFKPGDRVKCIRPTIYDVLYEDVEYTIDRLAGEEFVYVEGNSHAFYANRFKLVSKFDTGSTIKLSIMGPDYTVLWQDDTHILFKPLTDGGDAFLEAIAKVNPVIPPKAGDWNKIEVVPAP
jgi:hypothetical protein